MGSFRSVSFIIPVLILAIVAAKQFSDDCRLEKVTPDGTIVFDINVLARNASDGNGLMANYVVNETNAVSEDGDTRDDFTYYINVCKPLVNTGDSDVPPGTGMWQHVTNNQPDNHVGGTSDDALLSSLRDNDLRYKYGPGEQGRHCQNSPDGSTTECKRSTTIYFFCADVGYGTPALADEISHLEYIFVWNTCAACPLGHPIRDRCKKDGPSNVCALDKLTSLGAGNAILISVFVVLSVYLVLGMLYQRFIAGRRGLEQIPNYEMWAACFGNVKFGFKTVFSCCGGSANGGTAQYKNIQLSIDGNGDIDSDLDDDADDELYSSNA